VVSQPYYNAMNRMPETEELPVCRHYGIGVAPYSPLARGVLTGKYASQAEPGADPRAGRGDRRMLQTEWRPESIAIAQRLKDHAEARGTTAIGFAIGWVLANPIVSAAIAGPRTEAQWEDYLAALDYRFGPEDEALVDSLVPPGHPSTPGYTDPQYPIEGRPVGEAPR
jgi:aryl-alcohol dehydrogenase (NADP+)